MGHFISAPNRAVRKSLSRTCAGLTLGRLFLLSLPLLALLSTPQIALAQAPVSTARDSQPATFSQLPLTAAERDLEVSIWTADDHELPQLERAAVRIIQENPHSAFGHHLLAHVMVRQYAHDPSDMFLLRQAADLAQQAIDLEPANHVGYAALADILDLMGTPDKSLKLLDEAERHGTAANWRFAFTRARLMSDAGGNDKVLDQMEKALSFADSEPRIIAPYVVAILQAESSGQTLVANLEAWNQKFPSPLSRLSAAIAYADLGDFKRAHTLYGDIMKADPSNKEAQVNDGILLYRNMNEPAHAAALFQQVLTRDEASLTPQIRAMILAHLGAARLMHGEVAPASDAFVAAMAADGDNAGLIDFMTRTYRDAHHQELLVSLLQRVNESQAGTGVLYALLGEVLSETMHKHDDAIKAFGNAITLDPERGDFYNGMGLALYRKKDYTDALKLFAAATEIDPNDATARYNSACVLSLMGRGDEALASLSEAVSLDPRLGKSARGDADFAGLQSSSKFHELVQDVAH